MTATVKALQILLLKVSREHLRQPDVTPPNVDLMLEHLRLIYDKDPRFPNAFNIIKCFVRCILNTSVPAPLESFGGPKAFQKLWLDHPERRNELAKHVDSVIYEERADVLRTMFDDPNTMAPYLQTAWDTALDLYNYVYEYTRSLLERTEFAELMCERLNYKRYDELKLYLPSWSDDKEFTAKPYNVNMLHENIFINTVTFDKSGITVVWNIADDTHISFVEYPSDRDIADACMILDCGHAL